MSDELKKRTKKFALDVIALCAGVPQAIRLSRQVEARFHLEARIEEESVRAANFRAQSFDRILVDVPCPNTVRDATPRRCPLAAATG